MRPRDLGSLVIGKTYSEVENPLQPTSDGRTSVETYTITEDGVFAAKWGFDDNRKWTYLSGDYFTEEEFKKLDTDVFEVKKS